ncbi:MAG: ABC transporter ATP-binding protein [Thermoflexibacter sp.]
MKEVVLKAENLSKYFYEPTKFQVLKNISLEVKKGEFVSIVGKSGCGKSTLLYLLSTMDTDYEGTISMAGEKLTGKSKNDLAKFRNEHIGFVFQFHYLLPEFTVLQNVMIPALKLGKFSKKEIEEQALAKLALLGMEEHAHKLSSRLSGGQQQRVAIARALINNPTIIMGDEPTGNLDKKNTRNVFEILKNLSQTYHQTIIAVTHDTDFAQNSDRIIEMSDGEIINGESAK